MSGVYKHASYEFEVIRRIGGGAFGEVYEVSLPNCSYRYALKKLSPIQSIEYASWLTEGELLRRFKQEIRYQTECTHKNIVSICVFHESMDPFFVMDLADEDLLSIINKNSISQAEKIDAMIDVINGLDYLHNRESGELVHRDIKPANILKFGEVYKISDFGLIKNTDSEHQNNQDVVTMINTPLGTERYAAPEVLACEYSRHSDIFALGVVIDEMNILGADDIVEKCTRRKPKNRYQSVLDIKDDLLRIRA
ncbi:serine/threonine protein kinase [Wohlfahrtiimonas chitiniclastica]|uniref:serine/threonine protein kinase n=1 Tax=Wohlfahrtiimonas chitiniclastica TaxID=400946 RepID=UPI001BCEAB38|nr:serine/threonine-protein kinase [Wohlfahrtiimonas chitiniclastica]MBS7827372.1 serine/threonine protein kinase [Wohlfahrtiimonas chitiniclastica]